MSDVHELYPYLRVHSAAEAIEFYSRAFGGRELFRLTAPDGRIGHAQIKFGSTTIMLGDEMPERGVPARGALAPPLARRRIRLDGGSVEAPVFAFAALAPDQAIAGPAVVESDTTTVLLLPGDSARMDGRGWLDIAVPEQAV